MESPKPAGPDASSTFRRIPTSFWMARTIQPARALARYLERFYGTRRIWLVYGAMRDKAIDEVAGVLFPIATELVLTAPDTSRALRPEALAEFAGRGHIEPTVEAAINYARTHAADEDVIVITGSLFVVGEARKLFLAPTGGRWQ